MQEYMHDLSKVKILSHQESVKAFRKMKKGDMDARHRLIESCLKLAFMYVKKHTIRFPSHPLNELVSATSIAVIKGVDNWNPKIARLSTYVSWCVMNLLSRDIHKILSGTIYVPRHTKKQIADIEAKGGLENQNLRPHEKNRLRNAMTAMKVQPLGDSDKMFHINPDYHEDEVETIYKRNINLAKYNINLITDKSSNIMNDDEHGTLNIPALLSTLSKRESEMLEMYFVDGMTYNEIGKCFNLTRQRAQQIIAGAVDKLKRKLQPIIAS